MNWREQSLHLNLCLRLAVVPFFLIDSEPHLGQVISLYCTFKDYLDRCGLLHQPHF